MGLLANNGGTGIYYAVAPVTIGENVCKVTLWARDNDGDFNITGRLVRKKLVSGAGTGFIRRWPVLSPIGYVWFCG